MYLIVSPAACSTIFSAGSPGSMTTASFVVAHETIYEFTSRSSLTLTMESFGIHHYLPQMERTAVVGFAVFLVLICLFWTYGYIRRRSKKRY